MIHVDKYGNVIFKGEPEEIAKQYMVLLYKIMNERPDIKVCIGGIIDDRLQERGFKVTW